MAAVRMLLSALILCVGARAALEGALGDSSSCVGVCEGTYPLHTYPEEEELFACLRGCRLFSICQFVDDGGDLNSTKLECESACMEAYPQTSGQYACYMGCNSQMPFAQKRQEELQQAMPQIHLLFPLTSVRSFWSDIMDSTQSFISTSWTFYMQADTGRIIVFQSQPEVQQLPQLSPENPPRNELDPASPSGRDDLWRRQSGLFEMEEADSLAHCFSVNSTWLLSATLLLSVLVLLWICCATVATASEHYIPAEKLSIYGDLESMNEQRTRQYPPAALVVVHAKPQEEEEAGPLPAKMALTQSAI